MPWSWLFDIAGGLGTAVGGVADAATGFVAELSPVCRRAVLHTLATCSEVSLGIPGFYPLALSWGWLLLGFTLGLLLGIPILMWR